MTSQQMSNMYEMPCPLPETKPELSSFSPKTGSDEKLVAEAMMRLPQGVNSNNMMYRPQLSRYDQSNIGLDHRIARQMQYPSHNNQFNSPGPMMPQYDPSLPGRLQDANGNYQNPGYSFQEDPIHSSELRGRAENWTFEETRTFVRLLMDHAREFQNIRRHPSLWGILANKMAQSGFPRSIEKCKNRWKVLVAKYKKCHDEMKRQKSTYGSSSSLTHDHTTQSFEFYYQLETLLKPNYHIESDRIQRRHRSQTDNLIKPNSTSTSTPNAAPPTNTSGSSQSYVALRPQSNMNPNQQNPTSRNIPRLSYLPYQYSRLPNPYMPLQSPTTPYPYSSSMSFRPNMNGTNLVSHLPPGLSPYPDAYQDSYQDPYQEGFPSVDPSPTTPNFPYPNYQ